jgi:hypothetical protein
MNPHPLAIPLVVFLFFIAGGWLIGMHMKRRGEK